MTAINTSYTKHMLFVFVSLTTLSNYSSLLTSFITGLSYYSISISIHSSTQMSSSTSIPLSIYLSVITPVIISSSIIEILSLSSSLLLSLSIATSI